MKAEFQRENEDTLESIRQTSRELKLQLMTINQFIPKEYQVEECVCMCVCSLYEYISIAGLTGCSRCLA